MKQRNPKVKIDQIDLKTFLLDSLTVDPFWDDVYNSPKKEKRKLNKAK